MTSVLAVAVDAQLVDRIDSYPEHRLVSVNRNSTATAHSEVAFLPDLILVGTEVGTQNALEYARRVLAEYPSMPVVLVADADRDLIREATGAGIRRVMPPTISERELTAMLKRAGADAAKRGTVEEPRRVVVVASPKGGVGKTTISANLAAVLAAEAPGEVVLLDLDLQFGDVATVLDLEPEHTVADALHSGSADSMLLRTLLVLHPSQFYVLCGANHPAAAGPVTSDGIRKLVHQFAQIFRYVIVDTSAGLQEETLASLEEASDVVFVTTLDVATLRNVRKEIDVLAEIGLLPERQHVLLNRADRLSGLTVHDASNILGFPVNVSVPAAANVVLAGNNGSLAVDIKKNNTVRRPIQVFANLVSGHTGTHAGRSARSRRSARAGALSQHAAPGRHR